MQREYVYEDFYKVDQRYREEKIKHSIELSEIRMDSFAARVESVLSKMDGRLDAIEAKLRNLTWTVNILLAIAVVAIVGTGFFLATHR